jgi:carboxyl-terminal processing protease
MNKTRYRSFGAAVLVSGAAAVGISAADSYFEMSKNLEIFTALYKELNIYYVDEPDPGKLINSGIEAMLTSLDPYTDFIPESDMENYRFQTTGQYGGVGALIRKGDEGVEVSDPYEGYPMMRSGVWAGDRLLSVDGKDVTKLETDEVSKLLKGQAGTSVVLTTQRGNGPVQEHSLVREEIKFPDVPYRGVLDAEGKVGYIKLNGFTQTAGQEMHKAFKDLKEKGVAKLVLDLRGNGGGLLREAVNIVNMFVPKDQLVVETKGRIDEWDKTYRTLSEPLDVNMPLVVLVDGQSASASEIVSGALQDMDRAVIMGERTFGKGLVQQTRELYYNSKLKLTVAKYYIPSGRCIQEVDYARRDSAGKAQDVADSLITAFKTKNGRVVYDGRGILPDVAVEQLDLPNVAKGLLQEDLIYSFATLYRRAHETIPEPEKFVVDDVLYAEFLAFLKDKQFTYDNETLDVLQDLETSAKKERIHERAEKAIEALRAELQPDRAEELQLFKADLCSLLRYEIVGRYHYQTGRMRAALTDDPLVARALETLNSADHAAILSGTLKPGE